MSTLEALTNELRAAAKRTASEKWKRYQALVRLLLDGKKAPPADQVQAILRDAGRTIEDLPTDLDHMRYRDGIRDQAKRSEEAKPKLAAAEANLQALRHERQAFLDAITPRIQAASELVDTTRQIVNAGNADQTAKALRDTCRDPGLKAEQEFITEELRTLNADLTWLSKHNADAENKGQRMAELQRRIDALRRRWAETEKEMEAQ